MSLTPTTEFWEGLDGNWSTFKLSIGEIGKPWQSFRVLVSTRNHQIKLPFSTFCEDSSNPWGSDCGRLRGVQRFEGNSSDGFQPQESKSWDPEKHEDMVVFAFDPNEIDNKTYFSTAPGDFFHGGRMLKIEDADPAKGEFLGSFGMSAVAGRMHFWTPSQFRFTMDSVQNASFLQALREGTWLPAGYGYTAGAAYRSAPASLTIGHYNSSLLVPGYRSFPFSPDHDLTVQLAYIHTSKTFQGGQKSLLAKDLSVVLDSTEPYLQFPEDICKKFEMAFGLEFDSEKGLFLLNDSTRARLRKLKPSLTFRLDGGLEEDGTTASSMEVVLPFASFDLEIRRTPNEASVAYFPLRKAGDNDYNILGRAFFQEAYLIVNYPYNNFTVSQRSFIPTGVYGPNLTIIRAELGSSVDGRFALVSFVTLGLVVFVFYLIFLPFLTFFWIPRFIMNALFDKPRARRLEKRQKMLEKRWEEIHGK